ncbi:ABC transporter [Candidatus Parcubacteria bacterium]|nr:MAG: ABC transporter [Candidatus Parcubacteria bacterium]
MEINLIYSLIAGISIGGVSAYLGSLMLQRRMSLAAGPLGHLAFPGVALALLYGFDMSLGAFPFVVLGIVLIWLFENKTKLPTEALTAVVFASGVALSFLFLPIDKAEEALVGSISNINLTEMLATMFISMGVLLLIRYIYREMTIMSVSEDLASVEGINTKKYNFFFLLSISIMVALGVKLVGALLTAALVSIPAATAKNISGSMKSYIMFSVLAGILSSIIGIFIYKTTYLPAGILIILTSASFFLVSLFFVKKK